MTARTLRALTRRSPATSSMAVGWCRAASWASWPAGRACRCLDRTTTRTASSTVCRASEFADIAGLLGGAGDGGEVEPPGGGDGGGDGALDERGVGQPDLLPAGLRVEVGQQRQCAEHRTAQVREEHDAVAGVGRRDSRRDALGTRTQPTVVGTTGRYHPGTCGDLAGEVGRTLGEAAAVGDEDDAYHWYTVPFSRMRI